MCVSGTFWNTRGQKQTTYQSNTKLKRGPSHMDPFTQGRTTALGKAVFLLRYQQRRQQEGTGADWSGICPWSQESCPSEVPDEQGWNISIAWAGVVMKLLVHPQLGRRGTLGVTWIIKNQISSCSSNHFFSLPT